MPTKSVAWWKTDESRAVAGAVLAIAVGVGVVWFVSQEVGVKGEVVLITVLVLPTLVYLAISGRLSEITLPGGAGAKFRHTAATPVHAEMQVVDTEFTQLDKGPLELLERITPQLSDKGPVVLRFRLNGQTFGREPVLRYLEAARAAHDVSIVAFVAKDDKVQGYMSAERLEALVSSESGWNLVERLSEDSAAGKLTTRLPGLASTLIDYGCPNADALRAMTNDKLDAALVVDSAGKLVGVVEREQLIAAMLLAAAPTR